MSTMMNPELGDGGIGTPPWEGQGLTPAQERICADVYRDGVRVYNGRAFKAIEKLEDEGLVRVDWDMHHGDGHHSWRIVVSRPEES